MAWLKILGSGPSTAVPMVFNHWKNKNIDKENPKNNRLRSSFFLSDGDKRLLVECGPDFSKQVNKYNIPLCGDVFLSHRHQDHIGGVWEFENIKKNIGITMNVYCNMETLECVKKRFYWMFKDAETCERHRLETKYVNFNIIKPYNIYDDLFILEVVHGDIHGMGFRYKDFIFTPDMNLLPNESKKYMQNCDLWILQCNNFVKSDYSLLYHTHLDMALEMIEELKPKRAILTHLTDEIDYDNVSKLLPSNVTLAYDGMEVNF
ncbi:MAG: MBL fold metallo-hydrolase [Rickettsiales bacterium]|jgi:phosphoribosyl 1,2-cyclic phosphate phosphodiesterase|nr:MBL fold metallo-hydrolase [Rickettsiales bacterium]